MERQIIVMLDNIRSAHNVGSIFRTSDGAGVGHIVLAGYTPTPLDRFGRAQLEIKKTSLGASEVVPYSVCTDDEILQELKNFQEDGYSIVSVEQTTESVLLSDFSAPEKVCYVFGNEVEGVRNEIITASDIVVEIPMIGQKESLNVSVAAGIVLYH